MPPVPPVPLAHTHNLALQLIYHLSDFCQQAEVRRPHIKLERHSTSFSISKNHHITLASLKMTADLFPASHLAVVSTAKRAPLSIVNMPTKPPAAEEVVVRVQWTGCTPLDLHQADGSLLVKYPHVLGDSFSGTVVAIGPTEAHESFETQLRLGDSVVGFAWQEQCQRSSQNYITVPSSLLGRVPPNISMQAAAAVPSGLVTAFHTITTDLDLQLPWPIPSGWHPPESSLPILLWGASGTVGMYVLQVLRHWGYCRLLAVASSKHHSMLQDFGASACFDYTDEAVWGSILAVEPTIPYIVDCIGSLENTLRPLTNIARCSTKVAVMLPVIVRDATASEEPIYEMDVNKCLKGEWNDGVIMRGVRTHFYQNVSNSL